MLNEKQAYISFVTQLELLGYEGITKKEKEKIEAFIGQCFVIDINEDIKKNVISIRQNYQMKLPDAIIAASAKYLSIPLITADKGFKNIEDLTILIYDAT